MHRFFTLWKQGVQKECIGNEWVNLESCDLMMSIDTRGGVRVWIYLLSLKSL